jgi:predicted nucleotidyltransferase
MKRKDLDKIKIDVLPILKKADVRKAAFFGSYVRGDNTDKSDIDILVELPRGKSLFDLAGLQINLEEKLNKKVDVVTYRSICPHLKDSILSNQYPIL